MPHPEIFLVRHGETVWNRSGHYQGQLDAPLTENGQDQARAVGRLARQIFDERGIMPFYCSPLGRCRQTAVLICESGGIDATRIITDARIQELHCGHWQTWTRAEVSERWPEEVAAYKADVWNYQIPGGGENGPMLQARAADWIADIPTDRPVLAVSHGMIGRFIRGQCRELNPEEILSLPVPQGVIYHLKDGTETLIEEAA
tara:strand:- start:490 stop:1095 length:606 start_codon:yes stop_codon:yes gene_type:complete